ncbi:restriction endonuclease subunit S [Acinetobacter indicus]|uniref:restriction endonuclease subunit S n=1 Tax=Acinetobacter indicus TaxID=756892 RepID=UPI001FA77399|nr:restriction endonuclease subunit S [Acinetobacter indicus]UNW09426.1 restriction endonuclease subunit S [Acinetobacter indicus]
MVPNGWSKAKFSEITEIGNGQVDPKTEPYSSMMHIGPENVVSHTGQIINVKSCKESDLISGKYEFDENAIVYSKIRPNLNKVCKPNFKGVCSADMYPIWVKNDLAKDYLFQYMLGPQFNKVAIAMSMRTGMPKINRNDLNTLLILLPPLVEQKKISQILSIWDQAISATEKLLENSQQQKKALMQQLLTGKKRLLDENGVRFSGVWKHIKLRSLIKEIKRDKEENPNNIELLTVKLHNKGAVASGKFPNSTEGGRPYYKRFAGELIIGRQNLHNGGVAIVPSECNGLIASNAISSFEALNDCDINFILSIMSTSHFRYLIDNLTGGTGQKEVSVRELLNVFVLIPCVEEQQKIAKVLTIADQEIETLQKKLDCLKQEKKALMQQLLTGKKRVKVAA